MQPSAPQPLSPMPSGLDPDTALIRILEGVGPIAGSEAVALREARNRVMVQDAYAPVALPRFTSSAMDGYGVQGEDLPLVAGRKLQLAQRIHAGHMGSVAPLAPGMAVRLTTGAVVPPGVAAIVPDEDVSLASGGIRIVQPPAAGANIRWAAEDVEAGSLLAGANTRLTPPHLVLLAATGLDTVSVRQRARIGLLSSGTELVHPPAQRVRSPAPFLTLNF